LASMLTTLKYNPQSPVVQWLTHGRRARARKCLMLNALQHIYFGQK
jgi:hypothetical protein